MHSKLAWGAPYRGYTARWAAERLLPAAWLREKEGYRSDLRGAHVDEEGLLTKDDIRKIEREVFGDLDPTPETIVEWVQWDGDKWCCQFRDTLREACVRYGIELETALKQLRFGFVRGPGEVVLRKTEGLVHGAAAGLPGDGVV
jgi:hypothetical protein